MLESPKYSFLYYSHIVLFLTSAILLVGLEKEPLGWIVWSVATLFLIPLEKNYSKHMLLLHGSIAVLGLASIGTDTSPPFSIYMGSALVIAVALPYIISKYVYKSDYIRFPLLHEKVWSKQRLGYLILTAFLCWLLLPIILRSNDSYLNWQLEPGFWNMLEAYIGLNAVGIWDELFFLLTALAIFRHFYPFLFANLFQAVLFSSFLFAVGFEGWGLSQFLYSQLFKGTSLRSQNHSISYLPSI